MSESNIEKIERLLAEFKSETLKWQKIKEEDDREWRKKREEDERERREFRRNSNKQWGALANKMGTIVEDIVAPNIPRIAKENFGWSDIDDFMPRRSVRHKTDRSKKREFDVIAVWQDQVIINETKSTPRIDYINDFIKVLDEIPDYFPEYADKKIIPIFASPNIPDNMIGYLTKHRIFAMAMGDETMEILNHDQILQLNETEKSS